MSKNRKDIRLLLEALAILQILDGFLTYIGVSLHYAEEGNPIVKLLMSNFGIFGALILVKSFSLLCLYVIYKKKLNGRFKSLLVAFNYMYLFVVISWLLIIFQ